MERSVGEGEKSARKKMKLSLAFAICRLVLLQRILVMEKPTQSSLPLKYFLKSVNVNFGFSINI